MKTPALLAAAAILCASLAAPAFAGTAIEATTLATCGTMAYPAGQVRTMTQTQTGALCTNVSVTVTSADVNITKVNGTTALAGAGATGAGSLRTTVAQDTTTIAGSAPGTAGSASANVVTVQGVASMTPVLAQPAAGATGGATPSSAIVANNTTSVAIDASPGTLYSVQVFNNSATIAYLKLYDAAQGSTTCGSGTPVMRIPIPASTSIGGAVISFGAVGLAFATAITRCVTTGIADNDNGAPAATTYIVNASYK